MGSYGRQTVVRDSDAKTLILAELWSYSRDEPYELMVIDPEAEPWVAEYDPA